MNPETRKVIKAPKVPLGGTRRFWLLPEIALADSGLAFAARLRIEVRV